jgi:autotransporter-associated beta strand protein
MASTGANYYTVRRSTLVSDGAGVYNTLSTITLTNTETGTSYIDASVNNGTTYGYTVTAANAAGTSSTSAQVNAEPVAPAPTATPTLTLTPASGQVTLNWTAVPGATGYIVEVATSAGGPYTLIGSTTELTYVDTGLANNTTYYFTVQATNSGGSSAVSTAVGATTLLNPPTNLTVKPGNTQITITWPAVALATGYTVERSTVNGGPYGILGTSVGPSYTDNGLQNGTPYYYVVATNDAAGTGPVSTQVTGTPVTTVPVAPANLTATSGSGQVFLEWTPSAGATSYVVEQGTQSGGPYTTLDAAVTGTSYTSTGLANGTYYFVVAATGAGGTGANSNEASATLGIPNLIWQGGVSTAWDTATANWLLDGVSAVYADGKDVTFDDTAATSAVVVTGSFNPAAVIFNNSDLNYTLSGTNGGLLSGATGLAKSGSANVILSGSNSFTGQTVVSQGTLTLANPLALADSTLNYNNQGGALSFGGLTSCTLGGLVGGGTLALTNTGNAGVALSVGNNGGNSTFPGSLTGAGGSLIKIGGGTLTLTGSSSYTGATTTSGGFLSIAPGALIDGAAASVTGGQLQINGGSLISGISSNITAGSGGLVVTSGTATFNGGLTSDVNVNNNIFIGVSGGVLNTSGIYLGRSAAISTEPTAGSTTSGLYVDGGSVNISGLLQICTNGGSNSSDSVRIDSGAMTIGSTTTITLNNGSRWSVLDVNGGVFTSNDTTGAGIQIGGVFSGENGILLVRNGTAYANKITMGDGNQTSGDDVLSLSGGELYIGAGGIVLGGAGAYTSTITLVGDGILGAISGWSCSLPMTLGGDTIQAGNAFGTGYNITLSGALSGTTLTKTGNGILLLSGSCTYTGATTVDAGILEIAGTVSETSSVSVASGATLYLAGGSLSVSGGITNNGLFKISGAPALAVTGSFINNGVLDLINGPPSLPPNFVNNGTVLYAGEAPVQGAGMTGTTFTVSIRSYLEHTYQLQRASSLTNPTWTNVGSSRAGTGSALTFSDSAASGAQGFYQILVSP